MNFALMIIDLQRAFYEGSKKQSMDSACEYINAILPSFRKVKAPILWVQDKDEGDGVVPGTDGFELITALKPKQGEFRIHKEYGNSFNKTDCTRILKENNTDIVVITGYCAEHCVLSTYRGALDQDLVPVILKNGIASGKEENKLFVENISDIISYHILRTILEEKP
jgi:nicotinamidase-related amidase